MIEMNDDMRRGKRQAELASESPSSPAALIVAFAEMLKSDRMT